MAACADKPAYVYEYVERVLLKSEMQRKDGVPVCPEIHYRKTKNGILITGCYGTKGQVALPDEIDGIEVIGIGDYTFAENHKEEGESLVWKAADTFLERGGSESAGSFDNRINGSMVTELLLPSKVTEIGRYAFYRCKKLRKLTLTDSLLEIGGGAFTGCKLSEVEIHFQRGEQSCLKSILDEMRFALRVKLCYDAEEREETAVLLFPEHYEEAVENTPARILFTQHHGAGGYYRQCFYDRKLDYKRYDELFFHTVVMEKPGIVAKLALNRLRYPFRLASAAREGYETYVRTHLEEAVDCLIFQEDLEGLEFLTDGGYFTETALDYGICAALERRQTEMLSVLMDAKQRAFPKKRKQFEL